MTNLESINRAKELDRIGTANDVEKAKVHTGTDAIIVDIFNKNKERILEYFNGSSDDFNDYNWQIKNRINNVETLNDLFKLDEDTYKEIEKISEKYRWSISPYYLSLVNTEDKFDPIGLMCIPNILEDSEEGELDPMAEEYTNPAGSITRRYPDRLIVNVTNMCGMYCRFCQRKRNIGDIDNHINMEKINESIEYIKNNKLIRDVLITGGDPLTLSTNSLEKIIKSIREIEHVEIIRIGSRIPVTLPQRIDEELVNMLKKYHPIYVNTHFNHPREVTSESRKACNLIADAGISIGNQAVLLNGINNNKYVMMKLNQELLKIRVRPYYIFLSKKVKGATHFNCDLNDGAEITNFLRGNTSGMAIPTFIVNAPKGMGKISILKQNYEIMDDYNVLLTTWEGNKVVYRNEKTVDIRKEYENRNK